MKRVLLFTLGLFVLLCGMAGWAQPDTAAESPLSQGDAERGRLVFGPCRSCHFVEAGAGHGNGPNLHRIFGKVAGKQPGFEYYSDSLTAARFVWTPELLYAWLEAPMAALPGTTMMSAGVPDPVRRADLIAYLQRASVRGDPE